MPLDIRVMYVQISNPNTPCLQMVVVGHKAQTTPEQARDELDRGLNIILGYATELVILNFL